MSSNIRIKKVCDHCNKEFIAKTTRTRYCSHRCNQRHYKKLQRELKIKNAPRKSNKPTKVVQEILTAKDFLNIKEAATLLGVSERTFYRLMKDGIVPYRKFGGRTIIKRSAINRLFE